MASKPKLKPCPFCGGEAQLLRISKSPNGVEEWFVSCGSENCDLYPHSTIPYASAEIAAAAWNRRADNTRSAPVGNAAALRDAILGNNAAIRKAMNVADETANELLSWCSNHYQELNCMGGRLKRALESAANAPWRNCDRFGGDFKMLNTAWFDWTGSPSGQNPDGTVKLTFAEWLLEIAEVHHV